MAEALPLDGVAGRGRRRSARTAGDLTWLAVPLGLLVLVVFVVPWLGVLPSPNEQDLGRGLQPPVLWGGSWAHPFGTDKLGHDLLSMVVHGGRLTLIIGFLGACAALVPGTVLGVIAGYRRGWADAGISRLIDAQLALPNLLIALAIVSSRGRSIGVVLAVLALAGWAPCARVVRAATLSIRERPFILALRAAGASERWIMARHVLPNLLSTVVALATLMVGGAILAESALTFLGLGVVPPQMTWGAILGSGREILRQAWWVAAIPGILISLVVLFVNLLGDSLMLRLDPQRRTS